MEELRKELIKLLNQALELEHAARIQYMTHAKMVSGSAAEPIISRLEELAADELKHEGKFRTLIADYLDGEPSMGLAGTHLAKGTRPILEINIKAEQDAIVIYKSIYRKAVDHKEKLGFGYETIEHELRHIIIDEQEHVIELELLLRKDGD